MNNLSKIKYGFFVTFLLLFAFFLRTVNGAEEEKEESGQKKLTPQKVRPTKNFGHYDWVMFTGDLVLERFFKSRSLNPVTKSKRMAPKVKVQENQAGLTTISFLSRTTGKEYTVEMQEGSPLKGYIKILKRQGKIDKNEGLYNYGAQQFLQQGCSTPFYGHEILTREQVDELNKKGLKVAFSFKIR